MHALADAIGLAIASCYITAMRFNISSFSVHVLLLVVWTGCSSVTKSPTESDERFGRLSKLIGLERQSHPEKKASHSGNWRPDLMVLPYADISSDRVRLFNIRDCEYETEEIYEVKHFDRQILLDDLRSIDFIVVPFKETPAIAHTMLSFGLADGEHIVFSVEARLEQGQDYATLPGATGKYALMWVVGTERDLIRLRTDVRDVDVYLYPVKTTQEQVRKVFLAAVARVNEIARTPEQYDLLTNNCTTNIVDLVNELRPGSIPPDIRVVLPGHSDRMAYDLGLLNVEGPFEQIKAAAKINLVAKLNSNAPDFSAAIRNR